MNYIEMIDKERVPQHIAIIMDGNGRWAQLRGKERQEGHQAGAVAVPLNYRYTADEIKYCLDLADCEVLIFGKEFIERIDSIANDIPDVKTMFYVGKNGPSYSEDCCAMMNFCSSEAPPIMLQEEDHAAIYFSSGTTGFPKAILHNHESLIHSCRVEQAHHGQTKDDCFLCIPPLYHTGAKMHWFGSLLSGSKAVLLRGVKPEWILRAVTEEKCTYGRYPKWKKRLCAFLDWALECSPTPEAFIECMERHGYSVKWYSDYKYMAFTTPEGYTCRDNKLFDERFLKSNIELIVANGLADDRELSGEDARSGALSAIDKLEERLARIEKMLNIE